LPISANDLPLSAKQENKRRESTRAALFCSSISPKPKYYFRMETYSWYASLLKPEWAPPAWLFSPVWTVLYAIIVVTFGFVFYKALKGKLPWMIALPFALNLIFNFAFSPIQFGLQNNFLAALDILAVLATLIWALVIIYPRYRWIALANIPYLAWVSFATVLQLTITHLNW
jgi:translocator protein